jgi:hypothetical protein
LAALSWSLFTLSRLALRCLGSPSFSWFTHSVLLETAQRPSIDGHCIRYPQRLVGRGSLKAISTCCRRTLFSLILPTQLLNSPTPSLLSVAALRHSRLSPTLTAGTTHLCNSLITSTSAQGSWEGPSQLTTARYSRDRNLSTRYPVN